MKKVLILIQIVALIGLSSISASAQTPKSYTKADIEQALSAMQSCGTVLYVAAHPDDENTRLIAYLAQERKLDVYYLSLTRGDGGQNLIGTELGEGLGLIRTNELLAARKIDGGNQLFTRARDFGFSKNPEETFSIWPRKEVLRDVVKIIRDIKPDVILTRFSPEPAPTHGHHTASAQLALEAFRVAATDAYPEDMARDKSRSFQAKRIFWNISSFFFQGREKEFKAERYLSQDIGQYNALRGKNYQEIAADSRSQHKSQGFGSAGARGANLEYFQFLAGDTATKDILEGIDISWNRLPNGNKIVSHIDSALVACRNNQADKAVVFLAHARLQIYKEQNLASVEQLPLLTRKLRALDELMLAMAGFRAEACVKNASITSGENWNISFEIVNRSNIPLKLQVLKGLGIDTALNTALMNNAPFKLNRKGSQVSKYYSNSYWLKKEGSIPLFNSINSPEYLTNKPDNYQPEIDVVVQIAGANIHTFIPVQYKSVDPVKGEIYQPVQIIPSVGIQLHTDFLLFNDAKPKKLAVDIVAQSEVKGGELIALPLNDYTITPARIKVPSMLVGTTKSFDFGVLLKNPKAETLKFIFVSNSGDTTNLQVTKIQYDHIPHQVMLKESKVVIKPIQLVSKPLKVGYIMGAGDEVPETLIQMGYQVTLLTEKDMKLGSIQKFDAIITGIRAYNTHNWLKASKAVMMEYLNNGGTWISQYNTANFLSGGVSALDSIAPYPFKLSNDRVTNEKSEVKFLDEKHPLLNSPNKISQLDFLNWVQERGLYYPREWDARYTPLLSMHDDGEKDLNSAILYAKVGKGHYVYTGLSFFRELPAGVTGAYRIISNIISAGKK